MSRLLAIVLTISVGLTACGDPKHGAYHVRGIWLTVGAILLTLTAGVLLVVGAMYLSRGKTS